MSNTNVFAIIFRIVPVVFLLGCEQNYLPWQHSYKADIDTVFNHGSKIESISLNAEKVKNLTNLGMLWGFLKYHHPSVRKGNYNMDAELFRVLPKILATQKSDDANHLLELWVDNLGSVDVTNKKGKTIKTDKTILMPDYGYLFDTSNFPKTLINKLEAIKLHKYSHVTRDDYYIGAEISVSNPIFQHEIHYDCCPYPDAGLRLLALYRYWNAVQYFFPYRHIIGEDWNKVLPEFIPAFCENSNPLAYELLCLRLISRINDTHASTFYGDALLEEIKKDHYAPFEAAFVENKLVITRYASIFPAEVKVGDVIEKIDYVPVDDLVKQYLPYAPASNYNTKLLEIVKLYRFLLRAKTPVVHLQISRDGKFYDVVLPRIDHYLYNSLYYKHKPGEYNIINKNIGYIYPRDLLSDDYRNIKTKFKDTKGIIIDLRCYPTTSLELANGGWLKPIRSPFVVCYTMNIGVPGLFEISSEISNGSRLGFHYKGKLVIIVNERTISHAEWLTMELSTVPGAIVIGSTTAGADGDISYLPLPGGVSTAFSGIGILYPNRKQTQRTGVKVDKEIMPTIKGIQDNRDELLEYAVNLINSN